MAKLEAQPKALETDAEQACAATNGGKVVPNGGGGNPDLDGAARNAGSLGDRPLVVLTAGPYWAPAGLEKEAAEYHEIWRRVVVDAHHDMSEAPDVVATAARQVVNEIREAFAFEVGRAGGSCLEEDRIKLLVRGDCCELFPHASRK